MKHKKNSTDLAIYYLAKILATVRRLEVFNKRDVPLTRFDIRRCVVSWKTKVFSEISNTNTKNIDALRGNKPKNSVPCSSEKDGGSK